MLKTTELNYMMSSSGYTTPHMDGALLTVAKSAVVCGTDDGRVVSQRAV